MKIIDCFMFYNELDILKIRLEELYNVVDYIIIIEATITHNNTPKPLYFNENKHLRGFSINVWLDFLLFLKPPAS